ncbi:putative E3 ubiquitin-protein ligase RNF13-like [Homarus americanus]|uniref:Putative E3 ubiquitin-protein ligase RNF13-like n=2 Tax=Homarus americanus TaxID=6706 RepID=A0A8J5MVX0_HOMAM|nr:putative E3 ubiquitin-protein ligase RNF13-like [Homarus americanus]
MAEERRRRRRQRRNVSHNVECGPEGYQRLAESTDDEDEDEEEEDKECSGVGNKIQDTEHKTVVEKAASCDVESGGGESVQSPEEPPATVDAIVHDSTRPALTDTSSLSSNNSASSHGIPPGPVQIAVDVVNSPPPGSLPVPQPSLSTEGAGAERDYVV